MDLVSSQGPHPRSIYSVSTAFKMTILTHQNQLVPRLFYTTDRNPLYMNLSTAKATRMAMAAASDDARRDFQKPAIPMNEPQHGRRFLVRF